MATREQIKKEFFISLLKGTYEPAEDDIVLHAKLSRDLYKKYQYDLSADEFDEIGDELEGQGYFKWNADGNLALTREGLSYLEKFNKS